MYDASTYTRTYSAVYIPQLTHTRVTNATKAPSTHSSIGLAPLELAVAVPGAPWSTGGKIARLGGEWCAVPSAGAAATSPLHVEAGMLPTSKPGLGPRLG